MSTHQFQVEPGLHTITASATGYVTQTRSVDVQRDMTVTMQLQPVSSPKEPSSVLPLIIVGGCAAGLLMLVILMTGGKHDD